MYYCWNGTKQQKPTRPRRGRPPGRPGRSRGGLRKSANIDSVLVEEPFGLAAPSSAAAILSSQQPGRQNGGDGKQAGEGCYVRAMSGNKRYYGVLIDQASLQEASDLWFQDYAQSLNLNRRMKLLYDTQKQQWEEARLLKRTAESPDGTKLKIDEIEATPIDTTLAPDETNHPPSPTENRDTEREKQENAFASISAITGPTTPMDDRSPKVANDADADGRLDDTRNPKRLKMSTDLDVTSKTDDEPTDAPAALTEKDFPNRPIQKMKYIPHNNGGTGNVSVTLTRPALSSSHNNEAAGSGYRVLVATYCNVFQAAECNAAMAQNILRACNEGGNFVAAADKVDQNYDDASSIPCFYYQYEVLPTSLSTESKKEKALTFANEDNRNTAAGQGKGLHMSMGMHEFLQNTPLPEWFPLSHHQTGSKQKIMNLLSMKHDSQGNVVWDAQQEASKLSAVAQAETMPGAVGKMLREPASFTNGVHNFDADTSPTTSVATANQLHPKSLLLSSSSQSMSIQQTAAVATDASRLLAGTYVPMNPRPGKRYQIGVMGGGIAGLACCQELLRQLEEQNIDAQVVLLEGRDRLGGRLWTDTKTFKGCNTPIEPKDAHQEQQTQDDQKGFPVDLGASWIHGIDHNPLAVLAKQAGVDFITTSEDVTMLGPRCKVVDAKMDERMGKLFDDLLDLAADECWGTSDVRKPGTRPELSGEKGNEQQLAVRWYASKFSKKDGGEDESWRGSLRHKDRRHPDLVEAISVPPHRKSSDRSMDFEIGNAIAKHKHKEFSKIGEEEHRMLMWNTKNIEYALGANISDLSMKFWDSDERHAFEGNHVLLRQGYSAVVEHMFNSLLALGRDKFRFQLNFPIGKVEYARKSSSEPHSERDELSGRIRKLVELSDTCSVTNQAGTSTMYFDFLVCALPLGVLKESVEKAADTQEVDKVTFNPGLPFTKTDAIQNVGFGLLNKIYVQFPKAFWRTPNALGEDPNKNLFGNASGVHPHHYMFFDIGKSLGTPEAQPAILMSLVSGKEAVACEYLTDKEMIAQVMETLQTIFSHETIPEPIAFRITRWGHDKFSRGCYTYLPPGATDQDFQLLQSPINGSGDSMLLDSQDTMRLFFAGEHTTSLHPSMAHGAMLSGIRAAKEVLSAMKMGRKADPEVDKVIPLVVYRRRNPQEKLQCRLCHKYGSQLREGSLMAFQRGSRQTLVHNNCAEYSPEVEVADGNWKNVVRAANRGKQFECCICGVIGATIGCTAENCFRIHHFGCAEDTGWRFDRDGKVFRCDLHREDSNTEVSSAGACDRISMSFFLAHNSASKMVCAFCKTPESNDQDHGLGQLLAFSSCASRRRQECVHSLCAKYTNIVDTKALENSRMGMEYQNIFGALDKAKECHDCQQGGATVKCSQEECPKLYHVPCAIRSGWNYSKHGKRFRCINHRFSNPQSSKIASVNTAEASDTRVPDSSRSDVTLLNATDTDPSTPPLASSFQHNLFAQLGATPIAVGSGAARPNIRFESIAANDEIGGTKESDYASSDEDTSEMEVIDLISDSDESYHGHSGSGLQVLDKPLSSGSSGNKLLIRLERSSREELWNLSLRIIQKRGRKDVSGRLMVASTTKSAASKRGTASSTDPGSINSSLDVQPLTEDPMSLQVGDIIVSLNGHCIGSPGLTTLRMVLFRLKQEIDLMVEVKRHPNSNNQRNL